MNDTGEGVTRVRANRQAQAAVTKYSVLDSGGGCSLVELQALTGKTALSFVILSTVNSQNMWSEEPFLHWMTKQNKTLALTHFALHCPLFL